MEMLHYASQKVKKKKKFKVVIYAFYFSVHRKYIIFLYE